MGFPEQERRSVIEKPADFDIDRVHKLLRLACHSETNANEAHIAAVNAAKTLEKSGFSITNLCVHASISAAWVEIQPLLDAA